MSYRTPLEARLAKKVTRAITEFGLIEDGDRVMVGLSGGKDSWALMQILDVLRQRAPISFSLVAVNVNSGYADFRHDLVTEACRARGWECHVEHTNIGATMDDIVRVRVYVTQIDAGSLRDIHDVRSKFWTAGKAPASTLVRVDQLVRDGALIEIDADAVVAS